MRMKFLVFQNSIKINFKFELRIPYCRPAKQNILEFLAYFLNICANV